MFFFFFDFLLDMQLASSLADLIFALLCLAYSRPLEGSKLLNASCILDLIKL